MKYYIGLDAHKSTSTAVVVRENGDIVLRETFPTTEGVTSHVTEPTPVPHIGTHLVGGLC